MKTDISSTSTESLIKRANLPSLPDALIAIYQALEDDNSDADRVVRLLAGDAALAARTLRLASSAFYKSANHNIDLKHAVVRIGPMRLWGLLASTTIQLHFAGIDTRLIDMFDFWRHSLYTACLSRAIATLKSPCNDNYLYMSGLLHDIGKLVFLTIIPIEYREVLNKTGHGVSLVAAEKERFGFSHATLGARLLEYWKLPPFITGCVKCHHDSEYSEIESGWIVPMANELCRNTLALDNSPLDDRKQWEEIDVIQVMISANSEYTKIAELFNLT